MRQWLLAIVCFGATACFGVTGGVASRALAEDPVAFRAETIDDSVAIGYGVAAGDVDGDGKLDLILADKTEFVWYRNGDWRRFVLARDLTVMDNVCLAARDIDGDGRVEIAVGALWNPGDTENSGSVHYLIPPDDRTQLWEAVELPREPTVHRMKWVRLAPQRFALVVVPLHGRGNRNGEGAGVKVLAYEPPADVREPWTLSTVDESLHMTHNFEVIPPSTEDGPESLLIVGREGARLSRWDGEAWQSQAIDRIEGSGEVRVGMTTPGEQLIATIEPMHGDKLVVYPVLGDCRGSDWSVADRWVIDDSYNAGHAVAIGDLLGTGADQIVAGWRLPNAEGKVGLRLYWRVADERFESMWIDDNTMATEDAILADLDGDGDFDVVAAGRATKNLKVYWNLRDENPAR